MAKAVATQCKLKRIKARNPSDPLFAVAVDPVYNVQRHLSEVLS